MALNVDAFQRHSMRPNYCLKKTKRLKSDVLKTKHKIAAAAHNR